MFGDLYLIATPIGNLEDITMRALRILKQVDFVAAEDTRHTLKLLNYYQISKPLICYHRHNEEVKTIELMKYLKDGKDIALVCDAGTPAISDPGEEVVKKALEEEIKVIPIPGPCALINGLIGSGIDTKEFIFIGFLPLNKKNRKEKLDEIDRANKTLILYEAPHKLIQTLQDLKSILNDRKIVLARELTKIHEEYIRGNVEEVLDKIDTPKGEFVIIIEKNQHIKNTKDKIKELPIQQQYEYYFTLGMEKKQIIKQIAKNQDVSRNEIYQYFITK